MPAFDGTGPQGMGPMTGRRRGRCVGGWGFGRGIGRNFGRFFGGRRSWSRQELENYKKALQEEIAAVDKELADIK